MFGVRPERDILALVPAVVENCVQEEPPFVLYCHISAFADDVAEILRPLAVIEPTVHLIVGAVRSIESRLIVADAVIVPIEVPA